MGVSELSHKEVLQNTPSCTDLVFCSDPAYEKNKNTPVVEKKQNTPQSKYTKNHSAKDSADASDNTQKPAKAQLSS